MSCLLWKTFWKGSNEICFLLIVFHLFYSYLQITLVKFCFLIGQVTQTAPKLLMSGAPPSYIDVLAGSTVDFIWRFRVFKGEKVRKISWYYLVSDDNWANGFKLVQIRIKANDSNEIFRTPLEQDRGNRANCTLDYEDLVWSMNCRLVKVKAKDSALYGIKVYFHESRIVYAANVSTLKVDGNLKIIYFGWITFIIFTSRDSKWCKSSNNGLAKAG